MIWLIISMIILSTLSFIGCITMIAAVLNWKSVDLFLNAFYILSAISLIYNMIWLIFTTLTFQFIKPNGERLNSPREKERYKMLAALIMFAIAFVFLMAFFISYVLDNITLCKIFATIALADMCTLFICLWICAVIRL